MFTASPLIRRMPHILMNNRLTISLCILDLKWEQNVGHSVLFRVFEEPKQELAATTRKPEPMR
jgi:hypothetical protein